MGFLSVKHKSDDVEDLFQDIKDMFKVSISIEDEKTSWIKTVGGRTVRSTHRIVITLRDDNGMFGYGSDGFKMLDSLSFYDDYHKINDMNEVIEYFTPYYEMLSVIKAKRFPSWFIQHRVIINKKLREITIPYSIQDK